MQMSLKQINYFIATADTGQVSRAAKELHVSQSAITTAIKGLETLLDTKLFERRSHGVTLTLEGHQFLQHARHIMASVDEAMRIPNRAHASLSGTLNLVVSYTVAGYFIPQYMNQFSRNFPNIEVRLEEADRERLEDGLVSGSYGLAVMLTSNLKNRDNIAFDTLLRSRRRLWLGSGHPLLNKRAVSLEDVSHEPYIMLTVDEAGTTVQRYWDHTPYQPNVAFRTSSVEAVRSMVANGTGVSVLSDMVYRPWSLEGRRVEVVTLSDTVPTMDVGLAWAQGFERSPASLAFCEFMHLALGSQQPSVPISSLG